MNFGSILVGEALGAGVLMLLGVGVVANVLPTTTGWALRIATSEHVIDARHLGAPKPRIGEAQS
ncbi:hypothetical protein [Nocardia sp. NPDC051463]|uniref:hypothetical protein n=1 Tax=Nocardia sp. NPDC051463 TaxID=3154845 RepID=UPI0034425606